MTNFREWFTSSGKRVLAGKSANNNEELIKQVERNEIVLHTANPGSPFVNIKDKKPTKQDIYDAALLCAKYSQTYKNKKENVKIHVFSGKDIYKTEKMKVGTFGVKNFKEIIAKKEDIKII
jgi:predicted ribosome quality control (RQC) complex YloA/Tae2 family protein